jgi:hypothetical protein
MDTVMVDLLIVDGCGGEGYRSRDRRRKLTETTQLVGLADVYQSRGARVYRVVNVSDYSCASEQPEICSGLEWLDALVTAASSMSANFNTILLQRI